MGGVTALGTCGAGDGAFVAWLAAWSLAATEAWISGLETEESQEAAIQFWTWALEAPWGSMPRAFAAPRSSSRDWPFAHERNCVVSSPAFHAGWPASPASGTSSSAAAEEEAHAATPLAPAKYAPVVLAHSASWAGVAVFGSRLARPWAA